MQNICDIIVFANHLSILINFSYPENYYSSYKTIFLSDNTYKYFKVWHCVKDSLTHPNLLTGCRRKRTLAMSTARCFMIGQIILLLARRSRPMQTHPGDPLAILTPTGCTLANFTIAASAKLPERARSWRPNTAGIRIWTPDTVTERLTSRGSRDHIGII